MGEIVWWTRRNRDILVALLNTGQFLPARSCGILRATTREMNKVSERKMFDEETSGDLEGDFIEIQEGLTVKGVLERAFCTEGQFQLQAAYGIRGVWALNSETYTEKPEMILVGERPFFADSMRELKMGTYVELSFRSKEAFGKTQRDGNQREMWKGSLLSDRAGKGQKARDAINDYFRRRIMPTRMRRKDEETPF